jgi:taurine dioxygenase
VAIAADRIRTISVIRLHPVIGAEIGGVDLCRPLDAETLRQIKDAWHEHTVLLFRGQSLSEDDQRRFASYFGPVAKRVPPKPGATGVGDAPAWNDMMLVSDKLDANGKPLGTLGHGEMWFHTDKCYHRRPHRASFLYGIEIPSAGGHTKFSSMYAAYDRLPADLKRRLDGAMVMQGQQYGVGRRIDVTLPLESTHHCRQPIFVTNPGSGRKALYVASQSSMRIEDMPRDESEALLQRLTSAAGRRRPKRTSTTSKTWREALSPALPNVRRHRAKTRPVPLLVADCSKRAIRSAGRTGDSVNGKAIHIQRTPRRIAAVRRFGRDRSEAEMPKASKAGRSDEK